MIKLPDELSPEDLREIAEYSLGIKLDDREPEIAHAIWLHCLAEIQRLNTTTTTTQPVSDWQKEAERMAELHGMSFVVFRNGGEPKCVDPTKVCIEFTDKELGYPAAPGGQDD